MRRPRARLRLRTLLIAVAVVAVALGAGRMGARSASFREQAMQAARLERQYLRAAGEIDRAIDRKKRVVRETRYVDDEAIARLLRSWALEVEARGQEAEALRRRAARQARIRRAYERAATRPWQAAR